MDDDPLAQLLAALHRDGKPAIAWAVHWSRGGGEPVAAAWLASERWESMVALLALAGRHEDRARAMAAVRAMVGSLGVPVRSALTAAVRNAVPAAPTLSELVAAALAARAL